MSLASRLFALVAHLPPAQTRRIRVERDLRAAMRDGITLLADRYAPATTSARAGSAGPPVVLIRTPYGRRAGMSTVCRVFAERGYQVVIQSCRGTFGSGGTLDPLRREREDGLDTLAWLADQPWFGGSVGMVGPSYMGFTQLALAAEAPPCLKAIVPMAAGSEFRSLLYPGGAFALDSALTWADVLARQDDRPLQQIRSLTLGRRSLEIAFDQLPLRDSDRRGTGRRIPYFQDWLAHAEPSDPFWDPVDFSRRLPQVAAPTALIAGWYDVFLPRQLADFAVLRDAGRTVRLTIGPWTHGSLGFLTVGTRESLAWLDAHLRVDPFRARQSPVSVFVPGTRGGWRDLPGWPPPATAERWYLREGGRLAQDAPSRAGSDRYQYDPADPTPTVGGIVVGLNAGRRDNRKLESRPDVLIYTSDILENVLEIIGPVRADLFVRSSLVSTDFYARLCDMEPKGRSVNVCDGLVRVMPERRPADTERILHVIVDLWPTAYRFGRGHRLRLQVSSGAHPRFARNLGGVEPLATAVTLHVADQEVLRDPEHASALVLPMVART
jgi:putative CocE/NonD family hydrolase